MMQMDAIRSRWLDERMETLLVEARATGWSEEGQIIFVRMGMQRAYAAASNLKMPASILKMKQVQKAL